MSSEAVLVIGGGPAGLEAARGVAELGHEVILVERRQRLGGTPDSAGYSAFALDHRPAQEVLEIARQAILTQPLVQLHMETEVTAFTGEPGAFRATLKQADGSTIDVNCGAAVIATGFDHFDPGRETQAYGYYEYEDVITLVDAERMLAAKRFVRPSTGKPPEQVCFIQCVGSRDRRIGNEYCSKVCCGVASKEASEIRELVPDCRVFIFYIDMRMYGFWEDRIYWKAQEQDHVNFVRGIVTEVIRKGDRLLVKGEDTTMNRPMEVPMDMVILSVGMVPSEGTRAIGKLLGVAQDKHGFISPTENALDTVSTSVAGIYVAGAAAGPKDLDDSVSMAGSAAMKSVSFLRRRAAATVAR
ncbi:MAG TPA: FAD-dependent oxidoreductase [Candidatus Nanopelagicaceae bacterium]|nr:FAD-dependent oxidoreductase [Candidatus Nanopelagicaceae bacterium]